ncbi:DUF2147 domain-containing protein [Bradyrhizobium sp. STM 3557]|uniref:DUF2147 domain-containing protein n=1 Tax=Bradyrhizobium sp. STM 3557 TaxID=578920 RepID=UPI00388D7A37
MISQLRFAALALAALFIVAQPAFAADDAAGTWLTQAGDAKVKVAKCGGGLCGTVVWLKQPTDTDTGKPAVDNKNPNRELANRPIIGLQLFESMHADGPNRWSGRIYNADDGQSYDSHISVLGPDALKVEGCVGSLCGGETWTRAK